MEVVKMGKDQERIISEMKTILAEGSGSDVRSNLITNVVKGLKRLEQTELDALSVVLSGVVSNIDSRISCATTNAAPKSVAEDAQRSDYSTLNKANQGGEVEEQLDDIPGLGLMMQEAWQFGNIDLVKRYMLCIEKICHNAKAVISAQLFDNLR
jgi:hypothetical protein